MGGGYDPRRASVGPACDFRSRGIEAGLDFTLGEALGGALTGSFALRALKGSADVASPTRGGGVEAGRKFALEEGPALTPRARLARRRAFPARVGRLRSDPRRCGNCGRRIGRATPVGRRLDPDAVRPRRGLRARRTQPCRNALGRRPRHRRPEPRRCPHPEHAVLGATAGRRRADGRREKAGKTARAASSGESSMPAASGQR